MVLNKVLLLSLATYVIFWCWIQSLKQCPEFAVLRMNSKRVMKSVVACAYARVHVYVPCMGGTQMNLTSHRDCHSRCNKLALTSQIAKIVSFLYQA